MNLYFTPVRGKDAFLKDWTATKLLYDQAKRMAGSTGVGLVHGLSGTCAIDIDDLKWCVEHFAKIRINIEEVLEGSFKVVSPIDNRMKAIFTAPPGSELEYIALPPQHPKLELRCGDRYDVMPDSEHPAGGKYTHAGSDEFTPLPSVLFEFWKQCLERRNKERLNSKGTGEVPLIGEDQKMSVIHVFNTAYDLETVLYECGYEQKGDKWQGPNSESGSFGVYVQESYLNPWNVCYSHHASDGELANRPIDAFEIAARFTYPNIMLERAKTLFTREQASKLMAVNQMNGDSLGISVHQFNFPANNLKTMFEVSPVDSMPVFPADVLLQWPEPWPLIWQEWKKMPRVLSQELLLPTVLAVHAHMMNGDYITAYGRRPNLYFLTLAPSTAHKDGNSRDAITAMAMSIARAGKVNLFFSQLLNYPSIVTADTSFMESFREDGTNKQHFFWLNTEATRVFHKLGNGSGNDNVAALADKVIELVDGKMITAKMKVGSDAQSIMDPNAQMLFYTQPETVEQYITEQLVDSGFLGRAIIAMSPAKVPRSDMFTEPESADLTIDQQLADFYCSILPEKEARTIKFSQHKQLENMQRFHQEVLKPMDKNDTLYKMISRLGNTAEQLFCVMVSVCDKWAEFKEQERVQVDAQAMLPLIKYWAEVKRYVVHTYIKDDIDPLASAVLEVTQLLIMGELMVGGVAEIKARDEHGVVSRQRIKNSVRNRSAVKRALASENDTKNVTARIDRILDGLVSDGTCMEVEMPNSRRKYIGIAGDSE